MTMDVEEIVTALDREWDEDEGFLGGLRFRQFDPEKMERLIEVLKSIKFPKSETMIDRRIVRLIWFIPQFMEWQEEGLKEVDADMPTFCKGSKKLQACVEKILGNP